MLALLSVPAFSPPNAFHLLRIGASIDAPFLHHLEIDGIGAAGERSSVARSYWQLVRLRLSSLQANWKQPLLR